MADEPDFSSVVAEVEMLAQVEVEPALDYTEVESIVRQTARASTWVAETDYEYGVYVIPTTANRNGHRYRVVVSGTSGEDEPAWGTGASSTFTDGTVTFEEAGPHSGSVYDVRRAVQKCLAVKVARDELVDVSADGRSMKLSQRAERNERLMMRYQPLDIS